MSELPEYLLHSDFAAHLALKRQSINRLMEAARLLLAGGAITTAMTKILHEGDIYERKKS